MSQHPYERDDYEGPADQGAPTPEAKLRARRQADPRGPRPARRPEPQDHRPSFRPLGTRPVEVEFEGATFQVVPTILDDWEFVEKQATGELDPNDLPAQYIAMLGEDGYEELKAHVRETYGYVSARVMGGFMDAVQRKLDSGN